MRKTITLAGAILLTAAGIANADVIADRKAGFQANIKALKAIQTAILDEDMDTIAASARLVADWSSRMVEYFPEGSDGGDTKARAEIWFDFDDFTSKANDAQNAALKLASLAETRQLHSLMDGLKTLSGTCKACHTSYKD